VRQRVAYARQLVAEGHSPSALARILQISRQAIYRIPTRPPSAAGRSRPPADEVELAIVEVAEQNPSRRLPDRDRVGATEAGPGGEPQAGAQGDA